MCVNDEDLFLYGDFNSPKASLFNIQFKKCKDRPDCKTEDELRTFLKNKWILFIYN